MTSMTETVRRALQTALANRATVSIRGTLHEMLARDPSRAEASAASKAARGIAENGDAVLISLLPHQAGAEAHTPVARRGSRHASNYLTLDEEIIKALPCRVVLATEKWDALIDEGMRSAQQKIKSRPVGGSPPASSSSCGTAPRQGHPRRFAIGCLPGSQP